MRWKPFHLLPLIVVTISSQSHVFINQLLLLSIYHNDNYRKTFHSLLNMSFFFEFDEDKEWFSKQKLVPLLKCDHIECKPEVLFCTVGFFPLIKLFLLCFICTFYLYFGSTACGRVTPTNYAMKTEASLLAVL